MAVLLDNFFTARGELEVPSLSIDCPTQKVGEGEGEEEAGNRRGERAECKGGSGERDREGGKEGGKEGVGKGLCLVSSLSSLP